MIRNRIILHFIFWLTFLLFKVYHEFNWILVNYEDIGEWRAAFRMALGAQLVLLPARMFFVYWVLRIFLVRPHELAFSVLPWLKLAVGAILGVVLIRLSIVYVALPFVYAELPESQPFLTMASGISALLDQVLIGGVAASISLYRKHFQTREREQQLQKDKIAAELKFLRQQTNPHFLFNTLNNLYGLARRESPKTARALLQLSKLLRYMLYEAGTPLISLDKEIEIIRNYIGLEQLRYGNRLDVGFHLQGSISGKHIAPLLLLPLVENAFKHGASESAQSTFIRINLSCEKELLHFEVENSIEKRIQNEQGGIGIANLKRQLTLLYPEHELVIMPHAKSFKVRVSINLNSNERFKMFDYRRRTHSSRNPDRLYREGTLSRTNS